jgi:hypothetical protein
VEKRDNNNLNESSAVLSNANHDDHEKQQTDAAQENQNNNDNNDKSSRSDNKQDEEQSLNSIPEEEHASATAPTASSLKCKPKTTTDDCTTTFISEEAKTTLAKHEKMRERYCSRANEVLRQSQSLEMEAEEENVEIASLLLPISDDATAAAAAVPTANGGGDAGFPDFAVKHLAALVEGSKLPLSALTTFVTGKLNEIFNNKPEENGGDVCLFQEEATAAQIKLLAIRKSYIKNPSIVSGLTTTTDVSMDSISNGKTKGSTALTNIFEDDCEDCMWYVSRWGMAFPLCLMAMLVA